MPRERDSQRQKLYNAEDFLRTEGKKMPTVPEIEAYVQDLVSSAWFRKRYPSLAHTGIKVGDGRRRSTACASWLRRQISMPKWSRVESIVLHEVAHLCTNEIHGTLVASHGWQFASILVELVQHQMGKRAADGLKESFRNHRVRYTAPRKRQSTMTPEERQKRSERLSAAREARLGERGRWAIVVGRRNDGSPLYMVGPFREPAFKTAHYRAYTGYEKYATTWVGRRSAEKWVESMSAISGEFEIVNLDA